MASLWTCDALPPDFERLSPQDFDVDGAHLHFLHYGTNRAAVEEVVTAATLLPTLLLPTMSVRFNVQGRITTFREGGEAVIGAGLSADKARHSITYVQW